MPKPKILVFATGTASGGGSGFENLYRFSRENPESFEIVGAVSNHERGGVHLRADALHVPFTYFSGPFDAEHYASVLQKTGIERSELWVALSGWLKMAKGLDPKHTFNIHPALLSAQGGKFGGEGMYGMRIHEAVKKALDAGEISESGVSMHFVTDEYDRGPVFFEFRVPLKPSMSVTEIQEKVNRAEHDWQPQITNMVVNGEISWDGNDPQSLKVPVGYRFLPQST